MTKKVALVTGAAVGIGRAICLRLARDGIAIGVLDLNKADAEKVAREIKAAGGEAIGLAGDAQWDRMMEVNLKGAFIVTQTILPDMLAQGWGRIVNISSSSAQSGAVNMAHYSSAKGGIIALTKTLAQEFGPSGITVNNIPPRFVMNTAMSEDSFKHLGQAARDAMTQGGPIRRQGEPEDIAGAAAWLVSDEAGYVTGQTIGVNGGRYI